MFKKVNVGCSVVKSAWSLFYSILLQRGLVQAIEPTGKQQVLIRRNKTGGRGSLG
jgi:hypothetical protein